LGVTSQFRTAERDAAGIGYKLVPFKNERLYTSSIVPAPTGGNSGFWAISKNTKHLDKALAFIDWWFSYDGVWLWNNGRQGDKWDLDENGEPYLTRLGWDIQTGSADFPGGGTQNENGGAWLGLDRRSVHPVYGRQVNTLDWIKKDFAPADTALDADWKRSMNARDDIDYFTKNNMYAIPPFAPMEVPPENIQIIAARVNETVTPLSWQMVFARDQAEFDRLWAEMTEQAKGRGIDTVIQWYQEAYARAKATGAKYSQ
jgi:putative aldouronate transport system substrate-binding protein